MSATAQNLIDVYIDKYKALYVEMYDKYKMAYL